MTDIEYEDSITLDDIRDVLEEARQLHLAAQ